jgi:hypothetical protein
MCANNAPITIDHVRSTIEGAGYVLHSNEYKNNVTKLKITCPKGHTFFMDWASFNSGSRCPECAMQNFLGCRRLRYEDVKKYVESLGHKLVSQTYTRNNVPLLMKCPEGHLFKKTLNKLQRNGGCQICNKKKIRENLSFNYEDVKDFIESEGFYLISEDYINVDSHIKLMCDRGHYFTTTFYRFKIGQRCPVCFKKHGTSRSEKEVQKYVLDNSKEDVFFNDRTQVKNPLTGNWLELDIWIPSSRKAIEFNGIFWHELLYNQLKDEMKKQICLEKNIDLYCIDEKDWLEDKEKVLLKVKDFISS